MNKEKFSKMANSLMLTPHPEVLDGLVKDWVDITNDLLLFEKINTDNVEPMVRVGAKTITLLREDEPLNTFDKKTLLNNAPEANEDFVLMKKVVK